MASSSTEISSKEYAKRPGTSGIRGHLYETKLLSLIYFRAIHDDNIEEFHLATNVDKLGSLDDICFRAKVKGCDESLAVFIQAKHRENNSVLTLNSKSDLAEYFNSYLEIRRKFKPNNKDVLFKGKFSETKCLFVIYTTAKGDKTTRTFQGSIAKHLNAVIGTGDPGSQIWHSDENEELLCKIVLEKEITALAQQMAKCIYGEFNDNQMLMQDERVLRYHVILAQKVFDVSDDQSEGYRIARFRKDFFDIHEGFLRLFKDELCTEILKRRKVDYLKKIMFLFSFLTLRESPDIEGLYKQFGNGIIYKNGKFEFLDKSTPGNCKQVLEKINESQKTIRKTVELAVRECLPSPEFKVPASFGNKDLTIKGDDKKIERKLKDLTSKIVGLIEKSIPSNIIIIDDSMGKGFLQLSGGIASAVGNLLVFDDTTKLIKFNDNYESLPELAKKLFDMLKDEVFNLTQYQFNIKTEIFPKLSFTLDEYDKNIVSDFLSGLLFYTSQSNEEKVEEKLINEINNSQYDDIQNVEITSDAIFLKYHDEIQKWWMTLKVGTYLTKEGSLYKNAVKHVTSQPLVGVLNMMQRIKNKNYTFTEDAVNSIKLENQPSGTIIVTENSALTVAKLTQHLNNKDRFVLDLEYILNLSARDDKILRTELMNMNEVKTLIVIFDKALITTSSNKKINNIAKSVKDKVILVITNRTSVEITKKYFSQTDNVITDLRNSLIDMSEESQKNILENTKVIFQGNEVSLDQVLDNESIGYIGENILYKILHSNKNIIGKLISNSNYMSKSYIQRTVQCFKVVNKTRVADGISKRISTLDDIIDDVVLIIGDPGMGKSTLLTHLALKTKELYPLLWVLRINLLEYSRQFSEWQEEKTDIDTLESLKFMCQVALSEESSKKKDVEIILEESNDIVYLKDCTGDEWTVLELKIFLHNYNTKNVIILLDGFDEICPTYTFEVLTLIKAVKNWPRKHKMWITSRSYDKIVTILELQFGTLYKIVPLRNDEQYDYLTTFWDEKEILKDLNDVQKRNIYEFSMFMSKSDDINVLMKKNHLQVQSKNEIPFIEVYLSLVKYLRSRLKCDHFQNVRMRVCKERFLSYHPELQSKLYQDTMVALNTVCNKIPSLLFNKLVATPLHLNMIADYLYNQIRDTSDKPRNLRNKWDLKTNTFDIYEYFLETKLKTVRFQQKNQNDMSKPDNISLYLRVYADVVVKHKLLAAFAVFGSCLFDMDELKQIKEILNELKDGEERTGIICNVVNDIPIFVHSTFAEYFAVEYICDLLKSKENPKLVWGFILNRMFFNCNMNILVTLDAKINIDKELTALVERNKGIIFELLLEQGKNIETKGTIKSSLCEAIRYDLRNIGALLLSTIEDNLDGSNLMDFIEIVKETNMLIIAVKMEFEALIVTIVNHVRMTDKSKLSLLFENIETIEFYEVIDDVSTDEIVQKLHKHVWTRMDIVPDWANLSELSGQIYFI